MSRTHFQGPVQTGTKLSYDGTNAVNVGFAVLTQRKAVVFGTATQTLFTIPAYSQILGIYVDVITAWDSATSATLSLGKTGATAAFGAAVDIKNNTGRIAIPVTAAIATSIYGVGTTDVAILATLSEIGTTTAGAAKVTIMYAQLDADAV